MPGTLGYDLLVGLTMLVVMERGAHYVKGCLNFGLVLLMACNACPYPWNEFKFKDDSSLCIGRKDFASIISTCYRKWAIPVNLKEQN